MIGYKSHRQTLSRLVRGSSAAAIIIFYERFNNNNNNNFGITNKHMHGIPRTRGNQVAIPAGETSTKQMKKK